MGSCAEQKGDETVKGHSRAELLETRIKKAHVSVRRAKQLCHWLTSLHLQKEPITIRNYHTEFCTGVLLAKLIRHLIPTADFPLLNERALARGAAIKNIELSLTIIWKSKAVNASRIATSAEVFEGNKLKIIVMLQEIFDVYVRRALFKSSVKILKWFNTILKQYNRKMPLAVFTEADFSGVWQTFQSGTAIFCVIYHLFGPTMIGEGQGVIKIDPMRVINKPTNIVEFRSNILYVFSVLRALKIEICWDPIDWITFPDVDFAMIQLQYIYDVLKSKHCVLPPAMASQAGVTSGSNGEPLVVGLVFSDTITVSIPVPAGGKSTLKKRSVGMIGIGEDTVALLPIDSSGSSGRFCSSVCPFGLLSSNMKVVQAPMTIQGSRTKNKKGWAASVTNNAEENRAIGSEHVEKLKEKNRLSSTNLLNKSLHRVPGMATTEGKDKGGPKELTIHEYTKEGYKSQTLQLNPDGSIPRNNLPSVSIEVVAVAIEKLEKVYDI